MAANIAPFYMYEETWSYFNAACNKSVTSRLSSGAGTEQSPLEPSLYQHGAEILWPLHLAQHPLRTQDPAKASTFVVAAYLGLNARGLCGGENATKRNVNFLTSFLEASPWYRRRKGSDHIMVLTDCHAPTKSFDALMRNMCWGKQITTAIFYHETGIPKENMVPIPLVAYPAESVPLWHDRKIKVYFGGATHGQGVAYVPRRHLVKFHWNISNMVFSSSTISVGGGSSGRNPCVDGKPIPRPCVLGVTELCSPCYMSPCSFVDELMSDGCVAHFNQTFSKPSMARMLKCQYNLAWPGDHGVHSVSSRIYDGIEAGMINVFLGSSILDTTVGFQQHIPWREMSIIVGTDEFAKLKIRAIEDKIKLEESNMTRMQERLTLMRRYAPDILWMHPQSRVAENVIRSCEANWKARRARLELHTGLLDFNFGTW